MKLLQTNLYDPEPLKHLIYPKGEDKINPTWLEWKRRQVKPNHPKTVYSYNSPSLWISRSKEHHEEAKKWSDYYDDLDYYEQHRLKYEGFEYKKQDGLIELIHPSGLVILLPEGDEWLLTTCRKKGFNLVFDEGLSQTLFNQICKENGIKLKEI
jgi:hypothetical protein